MLYRSCFLIALAIGPIFGSAHSTQSARAQTMLDLVADASREALWLRQRKTGLSERQLRDATELRDRMKTQDPFRVGKQYLVKNRPYTRAHEITVGLAYNWTFALVFRDVAKDVSMDAFRHMKPIYVLIRQPLGQHADELENYFRRIMHMAPGHQALWRRCYSDFLKPVAEKFHPYWHDTARFLRLSVCARKLGYAR